MPTFWHNVAVICILCVPSSVIFAYYYSNLGDDAKQFIYSLHETPTTTLTIISCISAIQTASYGATKFHLPARPRVPTVDGLVRAIKKMHVLLPCKIKLNVFKRELSRIISDCALNLVSTTLGIARSDEIDRASSDCLSLSLSRFAGATIIFVSKWRTTSLKRRARENAFSVVVYAKVAPRYVDEFFDVSNSRSCIKTVRAHYKANGTDLLGIPSLAI